MATEMVVVVTPLTLVYCWQVVCANRTDSQAHLNTLAHTQAHSKSTWYPTMVFWGHNCAAQPMLPARIDRGRFAPIPMEEQSFLPGGVASKRVPVKTIRCTPCAVASIGMAILFAGGLVAVPFAVAKAHQTHSIRVSSQPISQDTQSPQHPESAQTQASISGVISEAATATVHILQGKPIPRTTAAARKYLPPPPPPALSRTYTNIRASNHTTRIKKANVPNATTAHGGAVGRGS